MAHNKEPIKDSVQIWTDGGCRFDSSIGVQKDSISGYAALIVFNGKEEMIGRAELGRSNSYMELYAILEGLRNLHTYEYPINIYTDSMYVANPLDKGWYKIWFDNGWKTSSGKPVKNQELWEELIEIWHTIPDVDIHHVYAHSGIKDNERVDNYVNYLMDDLENDIKVYEERTGGLS